MQTLTYIRDLVWGWPLLLFILGTGTYLTVRLRGVQFRYLGKAVSLLFTKHSEEHPGEISHFQSLMTALAGTIGIGNIAGVAIALSVGGVGALFWMAVVSLLGMATIYSEAFLAVRFRERRADGSFMGGPMAYISKGLNAKWLGLIFAGGGAFAALSTGNMIQSNSMTDVAIQLFNIPRWIYGVGIAGLVGAVLFGGIRKIGRVAGILVPAMALLYLLAGLLVLGLNITAIPTALGSIFVAALSPSAAVGGAIGGSVMMALRMGVARGVLASEAGLGSAPIAAAAAKTDAPGSQALIAMIGSFFSVCVVCMITGLVIVVTGALETGLTGVPLTVAAFNSALPFGNYAVIGCALLFGYSTLIGWAYYGEQCSRYLLGDRSVNFYRIIFVLCVVAGAVLDMQVVWSLADLSNVFMIVPNLVGVIGLSALVARETTPYLAASPL